MMVSIVELLIIAGLFVVCLIAILIAALTYWFWNSGNKTNS